MINDSSNNIEAGVGLRLGFAISILSSKNWFIRFSDSSEFSVITLTDQ